MITEKDKKEADGGRLSLSPLSSVYHNANEYSMSTLNTMSTYFDAKDLPEEEQLDGSTHGGDVFYSIREIPNESIDVIMHEASSKKLLARDDEEIDTPDSSPSRDYDIANDYHGRVPSSLNDSILRDSLRKDFKTMVSTPDFSKEVLEEEETANQNDGLYKIGDDTSNGDDTSDGEEDEENHTKDQNSNSDDKDDQQKENKYKVVNQDTGETYDIRDLHKQEVEYKFTSKSNPSQEQQKQESDSPKNNSISSKQSKLSSIKQKIKQTYHRKGTQQNSTHTHELSCSDLCANLPSSNSMNKNVKQSLPSNAVPVKCTHKPVAESDFHPLLLTQTLHQAHDGPIWCISFSAPGTDLTQQHYLATAGQDAVVQLWKIPRMKKSTKGSNKKLNKSSSSSSQYSSTQMPGSSLGDQITIIQWTEDQKPYRRFLGHTQGIVSLSWSFSHFLLSASLDKTVRLWHHSKECCLHVFKHADIVSSVDWHPFDDKYFVSGGFDKKLRVWCIPDGRVKQWYQTPAMITASKYTPNGEYVIAGLNEGQVIFYSTKDGDCKYHTQVSCKNRHDLHGKKVTGISFLRGESVEDCYASNTNSSGRSSESKSTNSKRLRFSTRAARANLGKSLAVLSPKFILSSTRNSRAKHGIKEQMLVTTNDSRMRLFSLNDYCMLRKYKGGKNTMTQIEAHFSASGEFIVCGSDNGYVHIWNTATKHNPLQLTAGGMYNYDKVKSLESFDGTKGDERIVLDTAFIPEICLEQAILSSGIFPTISNLDHIQQDLSSAAIVTADYEGTIRIFLRKSLMDDILHSSGPAGLVSDIGCCH